MSKKDFSVALKYVEARPRSQRRKGAEARASGISVGGSGVSATDLSLLQANLISVTNNFTALKDLFDSMFEKDSDGNIHAKLSLWSSGGITAGGVGSGGSGGGGISYNRLDSWADYSADKSGWVLSALLGKDLDERVSALANAGYVTQSALAPYVLRSEVEGQYLSKNGGTVNGLVQAPFFSASEWISARFFTSDIFPSSVNTTGMCRWGAFDEVGGLKIQFGADSGTKIEVINREWNAALFRVDTSGKVWAADTITSPSFIGNLMGTADRAFTQAVLYGSRDVNLWDPDASIARYYALADAAPNTPSGVYALGSILMEYSWDANAGAQLLSHNRGNNIFYRSRWNGAFKDWREIAFTDSNVASAAKLATPRTIWGQSFDGTQDVTGALTAPSITTNSLTIGGVTLTYDSVNEALCINGNMYALGGITAGGAGISAYTSLEARVARIEQQLNIY